MTDSSDKATFAVGHWTDPDARTGCTVVLFDRLVPAVVDVRGGAPGTRETDLLASDRLVGQVDAILLTGGSAHGLAAADGVMQFLRERGRGFPTAAGPVPIVSSAVIFDLATGRPTWPRPEDGYAACVATAPLHESATGSIGAGTGATISKLWNDQAPQAGGLGWSTVQLSNDCSVSALAVVNAVGDVVTDTWSDRRSLLLSTSADLDERSATTLIVIVVDGNADYKALRRITVAAHDAMARKIVPCHTLWDGDLVYATFTGQATAPDQATTVRLTVAAELAVEQAIRVAIPQ